MGLYERLTGEQTPKIQVHVFSGVLGEWERGKLTAGQAFAELSLDAGEQAEAATLIGKLVAPRESIALGAFVTLSNIGASYDATNASQGLGVAIVQTVGITQIIFGVRVNKIGAGTQSWQLWNDTDAAQIAVIDDAGGTGVKTLSTTVNFDPALAAGLKTIRVRGKSTTATDDPLYLGATVNIRRLSILTALELHEILLIAERTGSPYNSSAALKTRLGV